MLPRVHRITAGADYRVVQRKGRRTATTFFVLVTLKTDESQPSRFGFVASKAVGNAVVRNRVRRQLRHLARQALWEVPLGRDVVVRILPEAASVDAQALETSWREALGLGTR